MLLSAENRIICLRPMWSPFDPESQDSADSAGGTRPRTNGLSARPFLKAPHRGQGQRPSARVSRTGSSRSNTISMTAKRLRIPSNPVEQSLAGERSGRRWKKKADAPLQPGERNGMPFA